METVEMKVMESEQLRFLKGKRIESATRITVSLEGGGTREVYHVVTMDLEGGWRVVLRPMSDRKRTVSMTVERKGVIRDVRRDEEPRADVS
jgi:hypothetical protein